MDDNRIDCPHCGAEIPIDLTRCPKCGWNLALPEANPGALDEDEAQAEQDLPWMAGLLAGFGGWLVAGVVAFAIIILTYQLTPAHYPGTVGQAVLWLAGPFGALAGGFCAGLLFRRRAVWMGLVIGALNVVNTLLLDTVWQTTSLASLLQLSGLLKAAVIIASGVAGIYLYRYLLLPHGEMASNWPVRSEESLYRDLLVKVRYDHALANRLVEYERLRKPAVDRSTLIRNAIERWERDNR